MNLILFDSKRTRENLLPFTFTRPVADIRIGILTIREKWEKAFGTPSFSLTEEYLEGKFPFFKKQEAALFVNGSVLPDTEIIAAIAQLKDEQVLVFEHQIVAFKTSKSHLNYENLEGIALGLEKVSYKVKPLQVNHAYDIFGLNGEALKRDFTTITSGRKSQPLSTTNTVIGSAENIFLEEGAKAEASIFNTTAGPIYIGKDAEVMEGCVVRGPLALGEHAALKMACKVYGPTTLGPHCKCGGELNNVVLMGYSNKAHDGFLGNSVIGEWCNLGADTNNSNLKNNYGNVDVFNYHEGKSVETDMLFCGLIMGDHSKTGINTMFNTGTVVGVSANVFGGDFPPKFIPSFSWGGSRWLRTFSLEKSLEVAEKMMERRGLELSEADIHILTTVFEREAKYRRE
jgi:UDP-N-acetylglucosamine diphosphorylase/glucosamine-1-phosphate N-acetyltransferase